MMKYLKIVCTTAMLLGVAVAGAASAQEQQFPSERAQPRTCDAVKWNAEMLRDHPGLIDACREVIVTDSGTWARFDAKFVRVESDGLVIFSVRDRSDRSLEQVRLMPAAGQVAYLDDRPVPFRQLRTTDSINLYVPEGQYGFATQPGVPPEQLAKVVPPAAIPATRAPAAQPPMVAQQVTLPKTAGPLPWVALGGLLSLLSGLGLTLRRRS